MLTSCEFSKVLAAVGTTITVDVVTNSLTAIVHDIQTGELPQDTAIGPYLTVAELTEGEDWYNDPLVLHVIASGAISAVSRMVMIIHKINPDNISSDQLSELTDRLEGIELIAITSYLKADATIH